MAIARDFRQSKLDAKDKAMLEYAEKITVSPSEVGESDVQGLKQAGWSEAEILDIAALTSYRNFITRMADSLGVQLTEDYARLRKDYVDALMVGKKLL
ncbi:MAG: peroxidase [Candidatus Binatia bacterium]